MSSALRVLALSAALAGQAYGCFANVLPNQGAPAPIAAGRMEPPEATWELSYRRPLGQVAAYRLSLQVEGEQICLGERRPVRIRAELELREEVIAQELEGAAWLRVHAHAVQVRDPSLTFAAVAGHWPELRLRVTSQGELLDVSLATGEPLPGPLERAFASLVASAAAGPVVLPASGHVGIGEEWQWERQGARQRNRLLKVEGEGDQLTAYIASTSTSPLELEESIEPLGLRTRLNGEQTCTSQLELLVTQGLVARQQGEIKLRTSSQVTLALPAGRQPGPCDQTLEFAMQSNLRILFNLRLIRVH